MILALEVGILVKQLKVLELASSVLVALFLIWTGGLNPEHFETSIIDFYFASHRGDLLYFDRSSVGRVLFDEVGGQDLKTFVVLVCTDGLRRNVLLDFLFLADDRRLFVL